MPYHEWQLENVFVKLYVEGCYGMLFTSNCLLLVGKSSSRCLGLPICVSGGFV